MKSSFPDDNNHDEQAPKQGPSSPGLRPLKLDVTGLSCSFTRAVEPTGRRETQQIRCSSPATPSPHASTPPDLSHQDQGLQAWRFIQSSATSLLTPFLPSFLVWFRLEGDRQRLCGHQDRAEPAPPPSQVLCLLTGSIRPVQAGVLAVSHVVMFPVFLPITPAFPLLRQLSSVSFWPSDTIGAAWLQPAWQ